MGSSRTSYRVSPLLSVLLLYISCSPSLLFTCPIYLQLSLCSRFFPASLLTLSINFQHLISTSHLFARLQILSFPLLYSPLFSTFTSSPPPLPFLYSTPPPLARHHLLALVFHPPITTISCSCHILSVFLFIYIILYFSSPRSSSFAVNIKFCSYSRFLTLSEHLSICII